MLGGCIMSFDGFSGQTVADDTHEALDEGMVGVTQRVGVESYGSGGRQVESPLVEQTFVEWDACD